MGRTLRTLLLSALVLLATGSLLYYRGSQLNLEVQKEDQMLWEQAPGDTWLCVGGVMILISGSLAAAAVMVWRGSGREAPGGCLHWSDDRSR